MVLLNSMPAPRRSTLLTKTCVGATASVLIFGRHPTTSGHSGTIEHLVFSTRGRFLPRSLLIRFTTTRSQTLSSSIPWLVEEVRSTFASRWDDVVWLTISSRSDRKSGHMIFAKDFPPRRPTATSIFCDPPYHTMLARQYSADGIAAVSFSEWRRFLHDLARNAFTTLKPGGYFALLLAAQTEKDLPAGFGYLDHAFLGYSAALQAGFRA